jgi:hypothetical protein
MESHELSKYSGGLIQLIYQQGGNLTIPGDEILSLECIVASLMDAGKWFYGKVLDKTWEGNWLKIDIEIYLKE